MSLTTTPWRFCSVCRRHHDQGRNHIFTTKHKGKLGLILSKFAEKVRCARQQLQKPTVVEGELEPDSSLWCYFCELEVMRHVTDRLTTVVWGGLLEHMASPPHHKKTRGYWWVNGVDKKLLQNFLLFEAEYRRYKELVAEALQQLESKRELKLKELTQEILSHLTGDFPQEVRQLQAQEETQQLAAREPPLHQSLPATVYTTVRNKHGVLQNPTGWHEGRRVWGGGIVKYKAGSDQLFPWPIDSLHFSSKVGSSATPSLSSEHTTGAERRGKVTVAAAGEQLTAIPPSSLSEGEGNVHSGATPPWLKVDSDSEMCEGGAPVQFGPSEEEFLRHKERGSGLKRKNPERVGADFHLRLATHTTSSNTKDWFPSFGRVWNAGPRSHSLAEFLGEKPSNTSATLYGHHPTSNPPASAIVSDEPGPSGLHTHILQSNSHLGGAPSGPSCGPQGEGKGHSTDAWMKTGRLPEGVLLGEVRPYVRKRKGKSNTGAT